MELELFSIRLVFTCIYSTGDWEGLIGNRESNLEYNFLVCYVYSYNRLLNFLLSLSQTLLTSKASSWCTQLQYRLLGA